MPVFTVIFSDPVTGKEMLRSPIDAATEDGAVKKARTFQKVRASIAHWSVTVERPKATPHAALASRQMPIPGTKAPKGPSGATTFTQAMKRWVP